MPKKSKIQNQISTFIESLGGYCKPVNGHALSACLRGVFVEIEICNHNQAEQEKVREAGGVTLVVSSLEELKKDFKTLGFIN